MDSKRAPISLFRPTNALLTQYKRRPLRLPFHTGQFTLQLNIRDDIWLTNAEINNA